MRLRLTPHIQKLQSIRNDPFAAQQYRVRGDSRFLTATRTNQSATEPRGSLRAVAAGLFVGLLVNLSNTYYGLRIGVASQMSMVSALLGFIGSKLFSRCLTAPLTPAENLLLLSVSTATGCMLVTADFIGIIPTLEYLVGPEENGPLRLSVDSLTCPQSTTPKLS